MRPIIQNLRPAPVHWVLWSVYFILSLINLSTLPIAWIDEVQFADVGRNLAENGRLFSKIWGLPGTEEIFMAYPPFIFFYHAFWQWLLPAGIFWTRLPFLLAFPVALYFLSRIFNDVFRLNLWLSLLLLALFAFDRGIFESLRSYRVEVLELALLAPAFYYLFKNKKPLLVAVLSVLIALCHLSLLPMALLIWLFNFLQNRKWPILLISAIPPLLWLWVAGFRIDALYNQMFALGHEHTPAGNIFYHHFIGRFFPYYTAQPLVPLLYGASHVWCLFLIFTKRKWQHIIPEIIFLATSLYWLFMLGPFYRYNTPLVLLMFILFARVFNAFNLGEKLWPKAAMMLYIILPLGAWSMRHAVALAERPQREIGYFFNWLDSEIKPETGRILLIGQPAAYYYALQHDHIEYTSIYAVRNFRYKQFDRIYYLPDLGRYATGEVISTLNIVPWIPLPKAFTGITYHNTKLLTVKTEAEMKAIQAQYPW